MRLLIRLGSIEDRTYEMQYHYRLQGFIYRLLESTKYRHIHNKEGYKFFCFSNIFPITNMLKKDNIYNVVLSSPNNDFIKDIYEVLKSLQKLAIEINIGDMKFLINSVDIIISKLPNESPFSLVTATPIIIRIPIEKYRARGIKLAREYPYVYWRIEHPIEFFISQIVSNLIKKYGSYHTLTNGVSNFLPSTVSTLFRKLRFKKQISTKILMKETEHIVIGSLWEFSFDGWEDRKLLQFALDVGLGERNSLGFGFMNIKRK
jgi:CRISPR-associated endoribonuclease Cas6